MTTETETASRVIICATLDILQNLCHLALFPPFSPDILTIFKRQDVRLTKVQNNYKIILLNMLENLTLKANKNNLVK